MNIKDTPSYQPPLQQRDNIKPAFPKALDLKDIPEDRVDVSGADISPVEETEEDNSLNWRDVVSGALLVTGVVCGTLTGTPGITAMRAYAEPPAIERVLPTDASTEQAAGQATEQAAGHLSSQKASAGTQQQGAPVHIISHIDASEHIIEPFATSEMQKLENIKSTHGDNVEVDAVIVRDTGNPYVKIGTGGGEGLLVLAPSIVGWSISRKKKGAAALLMMGIGGVMSYGLAKSGLGVEVLRNVVSGVADLSAGEPVWDGTRVYHVQPNSSDAIDSKLISKSDALKPDAKAATDFIASQMKEYPGSTTVVHMVGHGLAYHSSSGFDFKEYQKILKEASEQAGRPIDLLVVESCLEGNVEAVIATMPSARYVVISEESIAAGILPDLMSQSLNEMMSPQGNTQQQKQIDAKQLGELMIEKGKNSKNLSTLALVDMEKVPALSKSVDHFGSLLSQESKAGRTSGIIDAVKNTPVYPQGSVTGDMGQKLGMGDLKTFAEQVLRVYGDTSTGKGEVNQETAASPQAEEIRQAAKDILARLSEAVPASTTSSSYNGAGGLSIQLPLGTMEKIDSTLAKNKMTTFKESQAPQGWKDFVNDMSTKMPDSK
ncbi:MAG: clostripain-related cysteine peptidase [Vulcanimicrobiota bacterium]